VKYISAVLIGGGLFFYVCNFMKTLGVIGGMGPQASIRFMELVIDSCVNDFGVKENDEFPRIILSSLPAPDLISNRAMETKAGDMLEQEATTLEKAGADFLVMTCNTMHILSPRIIESVSVPFISMISTVIDKVESDGIKKVGLLGSLTTMTSDLYLCPLESLGAEVIVPNSEARNKVVDCIKNVISGQDCEWDKLILKRIGQNL